jgi:uncharacterized protein (TIGR02449 family)
MTNPGDKLSCNLVEFENHIDEFLKTVIIIKQENKFLKHRVCEMSRARAIAVEKNRIAAQQIKKVIQQLKEEVK